MSDVYLEIQAYDHHGEITKRYTNVITNNLNPVWNDWVEFEENGFTVKAWDEDTTKLMMQGSAKSLLTHFYHLLLFKWNKWMR